VIYFVSYESEFCFELWNVDHTQKWESGLRLEKAPMFQIQDMFENGKPNIVLKTVKSFNIKRTPIIILILIKV